MWTTSQLEGRHTVSKTQDGKLKSISTGYKALSSCFSRTASNLYPGCFVDPIHGIKSRMEDSQFVVQLWE